MSRIPSARRRRSFVTTVLATCTSLLVPLSMAEANTVSPAGNRGVWKQSLREDFNGALNRTRWGTYDGLPGEHGVWKANHVEMHGGQAWIHGYREGTKFVTSGMMLTSLPQTYGKYEARVRFDRADGIGHAMMLWPVTGWPPEVDFSEAEGTEGRTMATAHWGTANDQQHAFAAVDMRQWHTYGVEWTPSVLRFTLDGRAWATMTGKAVPAVPMRLVMQTGANKIIGPISASQPRDVVFAVDWVSVYRYG